MNISFSELVVVFLVALLLFGPEQLPQIARQLGKITGELRKSSQAIRREWYNAVYPPAEELRKDFAGHSRDLRALRAEVLAPPEGSLGSSSKPSASKPSAPDTSPPGTAASDTSASDTAASVTSASTQLIPEKLKTAPLKLHSKT